MDRAAAISATASPGSTRASRIAHIAAACLAFACGVAQAQLIPVNWYHLGENDGVAVGQPVATTSDLLGAKPLSITGTALVASDVGATAVSAVGSSRSLQFATRGSDYAHTSLLTTATDNFGLEAWVKPSSAFAGDQVIAYNGYFGNNGFGLVLKSDNKFYGQFGASTIGGASASIGTWTHLAIVRDNGIAQLYVNGVAVGFPEFGPPSTPTIGFGVGNGMPAATSGLQGWADEVRYFTFTPGNFSPAQLLSAAKRVTSTADSGAGSLRNALAASVPGQTIVISSTGTITLASTLQALNSVNVFGPGAGNLSISGANAQRVLWIDTPLDSRSLFADLSIVNGYAKGGNGGLGYASGGGGMGAGGGLFINKGNVVLTRVNFGGNAAKGGDGSTNPTFGGAGGGGGLGGNGGPGTSSDGAGGGGGWQGAGGTNAGGSMSAGGGGGGMTGAGGLGVSDAGGGGGAYVAGQDATPASGSPCSPCFAATGGAGADGIGGNGGDITHAATAGQEFGGGGGAGLSIAGNGGRYGGGGGGSRGGVGGEFGGSGGSNTMDGAPGGFGGGSGGSLLARAGDGGFGGGCGYGVTAGCVPGAFGGIATTTSRRSGGGSALGAAIFVRANNNASLEWNDGGADAGTLTPGSVLANAGQTSGTSLFLIGNTTLLTVNANTQTIAGSIGGWSSAPPNINKNGTGLLILSGGGSDLGDVAVNKGELRINANALGLATGKSLNVTNTATLSGDAGVTGAVNLASGGTISPGNPAALGGVGTLTFGNFAWTGGGVIPFQLGQNNGASDHLVVNGNLTKAGSGSWQFQLADGATVPICGTPYTLIQYTGTSNFSVDDFGYTYSGAMSLSLLSNFSFSANQLQFNPICFNFQNITNFASTPAIPPYVNGGTFGISATGGASGNPVVFGSNTPSVCSVSGATVTMLSRGVCTLTANQQGNTTYNTAPTALLTRHFEQYTVNASAGSNGTIFPPSATVDYNGNATFTVSPNSGYTAVVTGDTCTLSPSGGNNWTTNGITTNCNVTATFSDRIFGNGFEP